MLGRGEMTSSPWKNASNLSALDGLFCLQALSQRTPTGFYQAGAAVQELSYKNHDAWRTKLAASRRVFAQSPFRAAQT